MPKKPRQPKPPFKSPFRLRILVNFRLDPRILERMREFIAGETDSYGQPRYRSQTQFVEEAIVKNLPRTAAKHRST